jgi:hypothetical protein
MPSTTALDQSSIELGEGVLLAQSEFEDVKRLFLESSDSSVIVTSETTLPENNLPPVPDPKVRGPGNLYRHSRELEMSDRKDYYK